MDPAIHDTYEVNSALQQQNIQAQTSLNAPALLQNQQVIQAALVEQTNPSHILEDIELKLRGYKQNYDGTVEQITEPLMNSLGIGRMILLISSVVNQNTILSHLESVEIGKLMIRLSDDIIDDLVLNWREYEIKDKMTLDYIVNIILFPSFMALKRAYKQNEKNWLNKTVVESINTQPRLDLKKKGGFFNRLKL